MIDRASGTAVSKRAGDSVPEAHIWEVKSDPRMRDSEGGCETLAAESAQSVALLLVVKCFSCGN